jgi:hypothetical protein
LEASSENQTRRLELVPCEFKYNHPDIYAKLLSAQNDYLETHRNIALIALPTNAMLHKRVTDIDGREWHSTQDVLSHGPGIAHAQAFKRTYDLRKWNISTKHDDLESMKRWFD